MCKEGSYFISNLRSKQFPKSLHSETILSVWITLSNTETAVKELEMIDNVKAPHCGERVCDPETKGRSCTPHLPQPRSSDVSTLSVLMTNVETRVDHKAAFTTHYTWTIYFFHLNKLIKSFIHSFIQPIFTEHHPRAPHCSRLWKHRRDSSLPSRSLQARGGSGQVKRWISLSCGQSCDRRGGTGDT